MSQSTQQPTEHYIDLNNTRLCYFEWGQPDKSGEPGSETILLLHATGFHARCWNQVVSFLPGRHVIALDLRGHGRSGKDKPFTWDTFAEDVVEFVREMGLSNLVAAGHSMGGCSLAVALAKQPGCFHRAVLVDPVIMAPEAYSNDSPHHRFLDDAGEHPVARRKNQFADADAFFANLEGRGSYASWVPECLHDYCEYGLLANEEGPGFKLACPPFVEASIYMGSSSHSIHNLLGQVTAEVTILRAQQRDTDETKMDFTRSPTWPELANQFKKGRDVYLPQLTHFIPMQDPELVAAFILGEK